MSDGLQHPARERAWVIVSLLVLLATALSMRYGTGIGEAGPRFDEQYITVPMFQLMEEGWTIQTAIDYEETKGPALIWPYAILGDWLGGDLNALRQVSCLFFVLSGIPLLLIALRCGVRRIQLLLAIVGFILLPYELVFSQLVMGEGSFVFGALCMVLVVLWGVGGFGGVADGSRDRGHPVAGPILYGLLLAILLHSRVHAVAWAGAACLATWQLKGVRSWPWWVASIVAGLLRVPLWTRWGGLVSPEYQNLHGLGFRLESLTYLGAALLPLAGMFLIVFCWRYRFCRWWFLCPLGAVIGLALALVAMPDLSIPDTLDLSLQHDRYQGILATARAADRRRGHWLIGAVGSGVRAWPGLAGSPGRHGLRAAVVGRHRDTGSTPDLGPWPLAVGSTCSPGDSSSTGSCWSGPSACRCSGADCFPGGSWACSCWSCW